MEKWLSSKPDGFIAVGQGLKKGLLEGGARQVVVIGNWKSLEKYAVSPEKISALRQKLGLGNGLVVCYLGTLDHFHYLSELLVAVEQSNHVILLISGRG